MSEYRKLPGRRRGLLATHLALLSEDHLVLVRRSGYRESYRRVELADVQAVAVSPTSDRTRTAVVLAVLVAALALAAAVAGGGFRVFWGICALAAAAPLVVHLLRGATCRVRLRTPIDWVELPSLRRRRVTERALALLAERVSARQGEISEEEARARLAEVAPLLPATTAAARPAASAPLRPGTRRWHNLLAGLLAGEALISAIQASPDAPGWLDLLASIYYLVELGVGLIAVASQARTDLPRPLRRWAIVSLVVLSGITVLGFYAAMIGVAVVGGEPPPMIGTPEMPEALRLTFSVIGVATALGLLAAWVAVRNAGRTGVAESA